MTASNLEVVYPEGVKVKFFGCILPASLTDWKGSEGTSEGASLICCDTSSGNNLYRRETILGLGETTEDTTIYRTGKASFLGQAYSINLVAPSSEISVANPVRTEWFYGEINEDSYPASLDFTTQIAHSKGSNLQDDEVWMDLEVFENSGDTLSTFYSDGLATSTTTPADQTAGDTGDWAGSPSKAQKLAVTGVSIARRSLFRARVCYAVASDATGIYVCPVVDVA